MAFYCELIFPLLNGRADPSVLRTARRELLQQAHGDVLEIGFGSGKSVPFYSSSVSSLSIVEPSAGMNRKTARALAQAQFPIAQKSLVAEQLPFADATFDRVVTIKTLCSVNEISRVLTELKRVLKPNGKLLFLEHVLSDDPFTARWQRRLNPIQQAIGCGCTLDRNTEQAIVEAGFQFLALERHEGQGAAPGTRFMPTITGVATHAR